MIKQYIFRFKNSSVAGKTLYVNNHKVHSGIYTMLFYKVSEDEKFKKLCSITIKFEGTGGYFNNDITHTFVREDCLNGEVK